MKKLINACVVSNEEIAPGIFDMWLEAPFIAETAWAGQFVQMYVEDGAHVLPRPLSVCGVNEGEGLVRIVYKVVGWGTAWFSACKAGSAVTVLGPLGNGFDISAAEEQAVVGGGIGLPPMLFLCAQIKARRPDCRMTAYLGFRSGGFLVSDFQALGVDVKAATDDGSLGFKGNVIELMEAEDKAFGQIYACGPKAKLESVVKIGERRGAACQVSREERMACGFGACVGCVAKIKDESAEGWAYKEVCKHGPVFSGGEVVWHD